MIRILRRLSVVLVLVSLTTSCSSPNAPAPVSSLVISTPTPAPGSTIVANQIGIQWFVTRGSGQFSVPISISSDRDLPYAKLNVYLWDNTVGGTFSYCGQNIPDSPVWQPFAKGQTITVTISGFQIFRVPCNVTSIRAWFHHLIDTGGTAPPPDSFTVATFDLPVTYTFR